MKGIVGIPVTNTLDGPIVVSTCIEGLSTLVLEDTLIGEVKFIDTTSGLGIFDNYTLTCKGDDPLTYMDDVVVFISLEPSVVIEMKNLNETTRPS